MGIPITGVGVLRSTENLIPMTLLRRKAQRTTRELLVSPMSGLVAGAMLLGFQSLVQPEVRHRIVVEQKEEALEDADGNPPPGGRLFHEQLRKIRRGEDIDGLTIQIKP